MAKKKKDDDPFRVVTTAIAEYLETVGWRALVIGDARVQQPVGERPMNYEFVVRFTGGKKGKPAVLLAPAPDAPADGER